ncbi:hypothetical protein Tco_0065757 [Tanacetum coccineum]
MFTCFQTYARLFCNDEKVVLTSKEVLQPDLLRKYGVGKKKHGKKIGRETAWGYGEGGKEERREREKD